LDGRFSDLRIIGFSVSLESALHVRSVVVGSGDVFLGEFHNTLGERFIVAINDNNATGENLLDLLIFREIFFITRLILGFLIIFFFIFLRLSIFIELNLFL